MKPTLVIMAAGMGSRFGGHKQITPVGPAGESILSYSLFDAAKAGFEKTVFIVRSDFLEAFRQAVDPLAQKLMTQVVYVCQDLCPLPAPFAPPPGRTKPFGTAHAVLSVAEVVNEPFAVINADDFYGREAFVALFDHLSAIDPAEKPYPFSMVGYALANTLSENGTVSRGVCALDDQGFLAAVDERLSIRKEGERILCQNPAGGDLTLGHDDVVSLNTWGFTPAIFQEISEGFVRFLADETTDLATAEYYIPTLVDALIHEKKTKVTVLHCAGQWHGVTYQADLPVVQRAVAKMIASGVYPKNGLA